MGVIGDMDRFQQFQMGNAMTAAAENPSGGGAADGMGLGMGFAMANRMINQPGGASSGASPPPPPRGRGMARRRQRRDPRTLFDSAIGSGHQQCSGHVGKHGLDGRHARMGTSRPGSPVSNLFPGIDTTSTAAGPITEPACCPRNRRSSESDSPTRIRECVPVSRFELASRLVPTSHPSLPDGFQSCRLLHAQAKRIPSRCAAPNLALALNG